MNLPESATSITSLLRAAGELICGFQRFKSWRRLMESKSTNYLRQTCRRPNLQGGSRPSAGADRLGRSERHAAVSPSHFPKEITLLASKAALDAEAGR